MNDDIPWKLINGDALAMLKTLPSDSVDCCVTSPPYYALRDYGTGHWEGGDPNCPHYRTSKYSEATSTGHKAMMDNGSPVGDAIYKSVCPLCGAIRVDEQIGLEETPEEYIEKLTNVFREVRRVLKPGGTCWINIGDSYWGSGSRGFDFGNTITEKSKIQAGSKGTIDLSNVPALKGNAGSYKDKDLIGIPWMLAFALRADGWYLRQDIIWAKTNCMPESVTDRCTKSHEYIFLLTKQPHYFYNADAIRTPISEVSPARVEYGWDSDTPSSGGVHTKKMGERFAPAKGANKRDVWSVNTSGGYSDHDGAHYASYNPKLIEPCILAGSPEGGIILDPFNGTGTTGVVAIKYDRKYIGIDLSEKYIAMSTRRLEKETEQYNLFDNAPETIHVV